MRKAATASDDFDPMAEAERVYERHCEVLDVPPTQVVNG